MRKSRIIEKLARDETAWCVTLHVSDAPMCEMVGLLGVDGVWLDLEHSPRTVSMASDMMRAARVGNMDVIARPAKGEFMRMGRMLEGGATGIMYPRCEGASEAREIVRWAKFCPVGERGVDGGNSDMPFTLMPIDEYVRHANAETFIIAQLEQPSAVERAEEILAVPGISMIMLGPADFTVLAGIPGQFDHPKVLNAYETIAAAARNTGKHWASIAGSLPVAKHFVEMGSRLMFFGNDLMLVKAGIEAIRDGLHQSGIVNRISAGSEKVKSLSHARASEFA